ncbi:MAG TPA: hypothetical protein VJ954_02905 [Ignavibacteriaceae bacterium]|nr:hypothetical protein [Ignavibacteriaceae bacterium]
MKKLSELAGETLLIHQPSVWKSYYELKHDDELLGTINSKGFFGINKIFKMGKDEWEIYRTGFWRSEIGIRQAGYELPYATYKRDGFKLQGTVKCYRGEQMIIDSKILNGEFSVKTLSGEFLAILKNKASLKEKTEIQIEQKSELLDKYPWVIILAWYLSLQRKKAAHAG